MYIHLQIALVKWTESVGLTLVDRGLVSMTTEGPGGEQSHYEILQLFPFTSEKKRMGIVVRVSRDNIFCFISTVVSCDCIMHIM